MAEESQDRVDKLQKNNKLLLDQWQSLQASKFGGDQSMRSPQTRRSASGMSINSLLKDPSRKSSFSSISNEDGENLSVPYIKNVLLGFLEHKEMRPQLITVIATLLQFQGSDEQRFLSALQSK